jgi:hypothetical protein
MFAAAELCASASVAFCLVTSGMVGSADTPEGAAMMVTGCVARRPRRKRAMRTPLDDMVEEFACMIKLWYANAGSGYEKSSSKTVVWRCAMLSFPGQSTFFYTSGSNPIQGSACTVSDSMNQNKTRHSKRCSVSLTATRLTRKNPHRTVFHDLSFPLLRFSIARMILAFTDSFILAPRQPAELIPT